MDEYVLDAIGIPFGSDECKSFMTFLKILVNTCIGKILPDGEKLTGDMLMKGVKAMYTFGVTYEMDRLAKKADNDVRLDKAYKGSDVERDVTQEVALCMNSLHITNMPVLKSFNNDRGIFEGFYISHIQDPRLESIKQTNGTDTYLRILACHALGAGAYVAVCQRKYQKPVEEFSVKEAMEINNDFHQTDPYELALTALRFDLNGTNKKCLDRVAVTGVEAYKSVAGSSVLDKDNLKSLMQVMFNAGVTLVYRD